MLKIKINNKQIIDDFVEKYYKNIYEKIENYLNSGLKFQNKKIILSKKDKEYIRKFFKEKKIETIMKASPSELKSIINQVKKEFSKFHDKNSKIYKFIYKSFVDNGYNKIDKFEFIKNLQLKTCPYCNRNYIYTIKNNNKIKPEIDHFYPKSLYPYLAVSFYNLIPSCSVCNGLGAKGDRDSFNDGLISPYEITYDTFKFSFDITSANILNYALDENSIKINLIKKNEINNDYFKIEDLYQEHRDIIIELYQKIRLEYSNEYIKILKENFNFHFSKEEIFRLLYNFYSRNEELHKRPLSKMIKDIIEELKIYY